MSAIILKLTGEVARKAACRHVLAAPEGHVVRISEPTRNLEQNALLWKLLETVSVEVDWYGQKLTKEEWKDVFTASLKRQKAVPALDGNGFVVCGQSTSKMGKSEFSDLIEVIHAFSASRGIILLFS